MSSTKRKKHPWRQCPLGEHWVSEHPRAVPISEKNPDGITVVDGHSFGMKYSNLQNLLTQT